MGGFASPIMSRERLHFWLMRRKAATSMGIPGGRRRRNCGQKLGSVIPPPPPNTLASFRENYMNDNTVPSRMMTHRTHDLHGPFAL